MSIGGRSIFLGNKLRIQYEILHTDWASDEDLGRGQLLGLMLTLRVCAAISDETFGGSQALGQANSSLKLSFGRRDR